ncbi:MAG: fructose-1,6-bisphosphatase [Succinatimonas sp.]|nr:fructose-1,6-bisphosphatase [Succinatimonas sp.]
MSEEALKLRYLRELSKDFPNRYAVITEIINLQAILNLPKGTEHFVSDVHGEYEAFVQIVNNCSGVIRDKVNLLFTSMSQADKDALCTLIYYPKQVLERSLRAIDGDSEWYRSVLKDLIILATYLSSKYTRSKVRKALPHEFRFVIDELMHAKEDEVHTRAIYHRRILDSVIDTGSAGAFIEALCTLVKRLAVDRLHVVGDIFDRGAAPDKVIDLLMSHHNMDIQWGNHDVLWMGAACGSAACCAVAVRNNVRYKNFELLERGYGISLRRLAMFAERTYKADDVIPAMEKAISVIAIKLQEQIIRRHPEYALNCRLLLDKVDPKKGIAVIDGKTWELKTKDFPTLDPKHPDALTEGEQEVIDDLVLSFRDSLRLRRHVEFIYRHGSMYRCCNGNLLYHGCIPFKADGTFEQILCNGEYLSGKAYLDYCDRRAREAFSSGSSDSLDFMWYLWCGQKSPLSGRVVKTFEHAFVKDKAACEEPRNPYYSLYYSEEICKLILREFGLVPQSGHIINGHTPVKVKEGESAVRGNGRLLVIDGGFSRSYQRVTGIAGYTLIYNSHNLRLKAHGPFTSIEDAIENRTDIISEEILVETFAHRRPVADTDDGACIRASISDLRRLLDAYISGQISESASRANEI